MPSRNRHVYLHGHRDFDFEYLSHHKESHQQIQMRPILYFGERESLLRTIILTTGASGCRLRLPITIHISSAIL
jgi:hypothetical protein